MLDTSGTVLLDLQSPLQSNVLFEVGVAEGTPGVLERGYEEFDGRVAVPFPGRPTGAVGVGGTLGKVDDTFRGLFDVTVEVLVKDGAAGTPGVVKAVDETFVHVVPEEP